ncbi:MAG: FAD-dependent oxidoreductase [Verrucomicrobia bacterium]|nr:FAD-dependent oxidoreductase [Verrucomicrobiota bacterium]MCH8526005.1 FAD-dependent oxidoreductase [Kiritimatiellia bacterium]
MNKPVLIVGGGLSGLACAVSLQKAGKPFALFESSNRWGGRAGSDRKDGFILDRGFQVFLDAYPTAAEFLDLDALNLKPFCSGALVARSGRFQTVADPFRHPKHLRDTLKGPLSPADLLRLGRLTFRLKGMTREKALSVQDESALEFLKSRGFSHQAVESFWRPFLGGIFLEPDLATSSRMFHFVFSLFARGRATLPREGMQAIPDQIAGNLPIDALKLNTPVTELQAQGIRLASGPWIEGEHVVDARDPWTSPDEAPDACGTVCFYFACDHVPWTGPWLVLCPEQEHINTLTDLSQLHAQWAPPGKHLLSVSCLNTGVGEQEVLSDLSELFGDQARKWKPIARMEIPNALPAQPPGHLSAVSKTGFQANGIIRCGDFLETASIDGALLSGKRAAEALLHHHA